MTNSKLEDTTITRLPNLAHVLVQVPPEELSVIQIVGRTTISGGMNLISMMDPNGTLEQERDASTKRSTFSVVLTFEEAAKGAEKEITYKVSTPCRSCGGEGRNQYGRETCSACHGTGNLSNNTKTVVGPCFICFGTGQVHSSKVCLDCRGSGNSISKKPIKVNIPPGVQHQERIEVKVPGGTAKIRVLIKKSEAFTKSGIDVHTETTITSEEAMAGVVKKVKTLDGEVEVHIPPGTWTGRMIELKGQGLQRPNLQGDRGMLIVHVRVQG